MMDGWNDYVGKKVFLRLKNNRVYTGTVITVDSQSPPLIFITILDRFENKVLIVHSEIVELKVEA